MDFGRFFFYNTDIKDNTKHFFSLRKLTRKLNANNEKSKWLHVSKVIFISVHERLAETKAYSFAWKLHQIQGV